MNKHKNGPIHFYTSYDRDSNVETVVEYVVQIGEHQCINRTQAAFLVGRGDVSVDNNVSKLGDIIPNGAWQLNVRGKNHQIVVHVTQKE
jgi:hypothetical protein